MTMANDFIELAFTESVRKMQEDYGTRALYEKFEARASPQSILTTREKEFVAHRDAFYLASVGENGWPYLQFRGGPPGFLRVLNGNVLAFADFRGNGQFISAGNFDATGKSVLFLMDYARRKRLKIWAEAVVLRASDHPDILAQVALPDYDASVERIFKFTVEAFDWNCPQHITQRYTLAEVKEAAEIDPDLLRSCCPEKD
jgi:predicted pyridoxine 5'-phosphate oxidase superfamily flavin-nucleotide-binding protein